MFRPKWIVRGRNKNNATPVDNKFIQSAFDSASIKPLKSIIKEYQKNRFIENSLGETTKFFHLINTKSIRG